MGQLNFWEHSHHRCNEYQKETARAVIVKTYGDYCLVLKENQKRTYYEVKGYFANEKLLEELMTADGQ